METTEKQKVFQEILNYRRSVRYYKNMPISEETVKKCLELAVLAPNSSNMQLWEFYHITNPDILKKLSYACLNQQSAKTAQQMVVFVTRQDLYKKRAKTVLQMETQNIINNNPKEKQQNKIKRVEMYYGKGIPFLYANFIGLLGLFRKIMVSVAGIFRPVPQQVTENDTRVILHKTCALAAQTFMLSMSSFGYDTCPMEGFDSKRAKKILNLPSGAEINMIVSCGIRDEKGIWGDRMRIPFAETYHKI